MQRAVVVAAILLAGAGTYAAVEGVSGNGRVHSSEPRRD